jgi:hypothetical protein
MRNRASSILRNPGQFLVAVLILSTPLKIYYALSRPLFYSGPDANGYIPAIQDFGSKSFLSPDISFQPYYPPGFPYLLSIFYRLSDSYWIPMAQVFQILAFSLAVYLFFLIVRDNANLQIAQISSLGLALSPAWAVANGEAMYETVYFSFLVFSLHILISIDAKRNLVRSFLGGAILGGTVVVHPRALLVAAILVFFLLFFNKAKAINIATASAGFLIPFLVFSLRNLVAEKMFTLSSSFIPALSWNRFMNGCQDLTCYADRALREPIDYLIQIVTNIVYFWSPYSGPLKRGSWFHNFSGFRFLGTHDLVDFAVVLSLALMLSIFIFWLYGTFLLNKISPRLNFLFLSIVVASIINDGLIFGDSRHRLAVMAFTLPAQALSLMKIYAFFKQKIRRNSV